MIQNFEKAWPDAARGRLRALAKALQPSRFISLTTLYERIADTIVQLFTRLTSGLIVIARDARCSLTNFVSEGEHTVAELGTKSVAQGQPEQKRETRSAVKHIEGFTIVAIAAAVLAVLGAVTPFAQGQDKYSLKSPGGIAFSDFRGYEDWADVSSARTDEILKVIVANPTMIKAFKAGVAVNGQPFPDGSMIVKLQWKHKKSTEAPFVVEVPDVFSQVFVMEKDSKRFSKSGGWGYAVFNYDAVSDKFTPDPKSPSDCGYACHTPVKAKDYIFHPYQKR